jgi:VWFA-related protein
MVVLDVVVEDQDGHPVRGLKAQNFRLTERGVAQTIGALEEHSSQASPAEAASYPAQPPGTFTDYTPIAPGATLNILLIDALNTPVSDRAFVRYQLQQYVEHADPKTRIAVIGLANRPILLQGFASDPDVLRNVVERKLIPRSAAVLNRADQAVIDPSLAAAVPTNNGNPSAIEIAANLREFEAELGEMETGFRAQYTLDAFNTLAHYLAAFPGRKNLIWFSGSFPLIILPDPSAARPPDVSPMDAEEFRETVNLMSKARVALYPLDARALMTEDVADARHAHRVNADLAKLVQPEAAEHARMEELAASTGGRAFYNANSLADAVGSAVTAGGDYYTLSYTPTDPNQDGSYRPIQAETVSVNGSQRLLLFYRHGYYNGEGSHDREPQQDAAAATPGEARAAAYKQAAMSHGAPTPEDLIFKVRVLPATTTETSPAPANQLALSVPSNGPFRRYDLDYVALPSELTFTQQPDGHQAAKVEFLAYVYDTEGRLLDETGKDVSFEATSTNIAKLFHSTLRCHLELSVPDRAETFLRIGIRDVPSNKFGVIEIPASSVSHLPAAAQGPAPTSGRPTPRRD